MELNKFPERGEIYLVCLDPTVGSEINKTRPGLVISNNINNQYAQTITVIPITSNSGKIYPFEVFLSSQNSELSKNSKVKCNQIRTVGKKRLVKVIGKITLPKLKEIEKALSLHLGFQNIL